MLYPYIDLVPELNYGALSLDFNDKLTNLEVLSSMQRSINEIIDIVNGFESSANAYTDTQIGIVNQTINDLRISLNNSISNLNTTLTNNLNNAVADLEEQIETVDDNSKTYTDTKISVLKDYVDENDEELRREIVEAVPYVLDPTTGVYSPIQVALNNIFNAYKPNAITAEEYDALLLTAQNYDAKSISAYDYDMSAKVLLV